MAASHGDTRWPTQVPHAGTAATRTRSRWLTGATVLWALIPLLTVGMLAAVPIIHAAAKLRRVWLSLSAAAYVGATVFALVYIPPAEAANTSVIGDVATGFTLVLAFGGTLHAFLLRNRVFQRPEPVDPAIAHALAARQRREESRSLAASDPALARELRIGRPDLPREYDDGGLIDVNHVPPGVLVSHLDFSKGQAGQAVQRRASIGGFASVQELSVYCDLPPSFADELSDRVVFLP